jgi:outer membrane protein assembly factor BamB
MRVLRILFVLALTLSDVSGEWAQWRGPTRDGVVQGVELPEVWPDELQMVWKKKVGYGYASPIASEGAVYTFTREKDDEILTKLDLVSGKERWRSKYEALLDLNWYGSGNHPKSTPALDGARLVTFGITGILTCWDTSSGDVIWQKTFADEFEEAYPKFGAAASPLIADGKVFVHVGGQKGGALRCFSLESGEVVWSWSADGPGYSSPILMETAGGQNLVTLAEHFLISLDTTTGEESWHIAFETAQDQNVITTLAASDTLFYSGYEAGSFAIRVQNDGGWKTEEIWNQPGISQFMGSPVLTHGQLIGFDHKKKGRLFGLDASTGEVLWLTRGRWGKTASIAVIGGHIAVLSDDGQLSFVPVSRDGYKTAAHYTVGDETWAHPAFVDGHIIIKEERHVSVWKF